jgi:hypothetical protein
LKKAASALGNAAGTARNTAAAGTIANGGERGRNHQPGCLVRLNLQKLVLFLHFGQCQLLVYQLFLRPLLSQATLLRPRRFPSRLSSAHCNFFYAGDCGSTAALRFAFTMLKLQIPNN